MALQFPNSPTNGQVYVEPTTGNRYVYNAAHVRWDFAANAASIFANDSQLLFTTSRIVTGANGAYYDSTSNTVYFNTVNASTNVVAQYFIGNGAALTGIVTDFSPAFNTANAAYLNSNTAFDVANAAFASANNVAPQVAPAYNTANAAYVVANAAFGKANTVNTFAYGVAVNAAAAFAAANNVAPQVTPAFNTANAAYTVANSAYTFANGVSTNTTAAFGFANGVATNTTSAFTSANTAGSLANQAGVIANAAFGAANAEYTFSNTVYAAVNSAFAVINAAYTSSNADYVVTNAAYTTANAGFSAANQAGTVANNANTYASSTYVKKAGDTITGDLVVQGNLTTSGVVTYANTQTLLIGDALITLNNDIPAAVAPSEDAGIEVKRGSSANVSILWREGSDTWTLTENGTVWYDIATNNDIQSANNYSGAMANSANAYATATYATITTVATNATSANNYAGAMANSGNVFTGTVYAAVNSAFAVVNAAYTSSNADYVLTNAAFTQSNTDNVRLSAAYVSTNAGYTVANAAFGKANTALQNTTGTFAGSLTITNALTAAGRIFASGGLQVSGNLSLTGASSPGLYSYEYPYVRQYVGDGSGYSFAFTKRTSSNVVTDMFVINDITGNIGIGNTAPVLKLEVAGNMSVDAFVENSANIATSYSITTGRNAFSAGPVTINSGVTITIPSGSVWTVS